jgi:Domain of unknown function (DUF4192)
MSAHSAAPHAYGMTQTLTAGDDLPPAQNNLQPDLVVRAGSPAALLRLIPHLIGFVPEASLLVIGVTPPRDRIKVTLRYDLPDPPDPDQAADIAAHAVGVLRSQRLTAAVAIGYGSDSLVTPVAHALRDEARRAGLEVRDFLRAADGRYWSYLCRSEGCCPADGVPFDPEAADPAEAAALARVGDRVLASRAALAARVAPLGGITAKSMRQATRRAEQHVAGLLAKVRKSSRLGAARNMIAAEGLAASGALIARYRDGGRFTSDYEIARITVALRDLRVRDDAWARMDPAQSAAHLLLWTDVVRRAQPGYVAAPGALLAFVAWQSGDGALANVALDRALSDDPDYSMALLLRQVITAGAPPSLARLPMTPEEVAASYHDAEYDDAEYDDAEYGHGQYRDDDEHDYHEYDDQYDGDHDPDVDDRALDADDED